MELNQGNGEIQSESLKTFTPDLHSVMAGAIAAVAGQHIEFEYSM